MEEIENLEQIVNFLTPVDKVLNTYCDKKSFSEIKNTILSKEKSSVKSPLGKVWRETINNNDFEGTDFLLQFISNINDKFEDGSTALQIAAQNNEASIVRLLLDKGADFDSKDLNSAPSEIKQILLPKVEEMKSHCKYNDIYEAAGSGDIGSVKILVEFCDVNVETKDNNSRNTPLNLASANDHIEVVKFLVEHYHAYAGTKDIYGRTPLNLASRNGHIEVVKYLIEHCHADVETKDNDGLTPLNNASRYGIMEVVKYLVENGYKVTDRDLRYVKNSEIKQYLRKHRK